MDFELTWCDIGRDWRRGRNGCLRDVRGVGELQNVQKYTVKELKYLERVP